MSLSPAKLAKLLRRVYKAVSGHNYVRSPTTTTPSGVVMLDRDSSRWTRIGDGSKKGYSMYRCECGTERQVWDMDVRRGGSRSCGCLNREKVTTHGKTNTPEFNAWHAMLQRCQNKESKKYPDYGGRGITVCDRWLSFENFLADMGTRPTPKHSIERKDNDKGYYPENCKWATSREQTRNRRSNRNITFQGRTQCLRDWSVELGVVYSVLWGRLKSGWSVEKAFSTPVQQQGRTHAS